MTKKLITLFAWALLIFGASMLIALAWLNSAWAGATATMITGAVLLLEVKFPR